MRDVRHALQGLVRRPGFSTAVILTLAIAIGSTTAIFTVVDAALLRPFPYSDPDRIAFLWEVEPDEPEPRPASYPDFLDWHQTSAFEQIAAYNTETLTFPTALGQERIIAGRVTASFFPLLGVNAAIGRTFHQSEDAAGAERVVVLNHKTWQDRFGGDPDAVGKTVRLSGVPFTIIGVLPRTFHFAPLGDAELWLPFAATANEMASRTRHWLFTIGRLADGATLEQAQGELQRVGAAIAADFPDSHRETSIRIVPLREQLIGRLAPVFVTLLVSVGLVLLVACTNVASLMVVRSSGRQQEFATRVALGASRWRLRRQLLTESLVLTTLGAAGGLVIAHIGLPALLGAIPGSLQTALPYVAEATIDRRVFAFSMSVCLLAAALFGLAPDLRLAHGSADRALRTRSTLGAGRRLRESVVVIEVAVAMVLLTATGLGARSLAAVLDVELGFDPRNLLVMQMTLPASSADGRAIVILEDLVQRLNATPGITGAAHIDRLPLEGGNSGDMIVEGAPEASTDPPSANIRVVNRDYFSVVGIELLAGRGFSDRDRLDQPRVAIINETLARRLFQSAPAVGRHIAFTFMPDRGFDVIGVVADERVEGLDQPLSPVIYAPYSQLLPFRSSPSLSAVLMVRTAGDPIATAGPVRQAIRSVEPGIAVHGITTMEQMIVDSPASFSRRYPTLLLAVFAAIALALTIVGVHGVFAYNVSQRMPELGLRLALGADIGWIYRAVLGRGLLLAVLGIALGATGSLILADGLEALLFGVRATDPSMYCAAALVMIASALTACYLPARRAVRVDPASTLRDVTIPG